MGWAAGGRKGKSVVLSSPSTSNSDNSGTVYTVEETLRESVMVLVSKGGGGGQ